MMPLKLPSNKVFTIKVKSKTMTYAEALPDMRSRYFVLGFDNVMLARKVQYNIAQDPSFRLYRRDHIDVTDEVNIGLRACNVDKLKGNVIIDPRAHLHVPKADESTRLIQAMNESMFHLETIDKEEFLMYPFDKNLGIIMPYDIVNENDYEMVLLSNVVENSDSVESFRMSLKLGE